MKKMTIVCLAALAVLGPGQARTLAQVQTQEQTAPQAQPPAQTQCSSDSLAGTPTWCNPRLAGTLSVFLPGLGQMYAGETLKGAALTTVFVGGVVAVATANITLTHDSIRPGGWAAVIVVASSYLYALIDSPFAAARWNDRYHLVEPRVTIAPGHQSIFTISVPL